MLNELNYFQHNIIYLLSGKIRNTTKLFTTLKKPGNKIRSELKNNRKFLNDETSRNQFPICVPPHSVKDLHFRKKNPNFSTRNTICTNREHRFSARPEMNDIEEWWRWEKGCPFSSGLFPRRVTAKSSLFGSRAPTLAPKMLNIVVSLAPLQRFSHSQLPRVTWSSV